MSEGGKLKLLAVASPERIALLPDVPTVAEAGVPGYTMASWFGLLAPAKNVEVNRGAALRRDQDGG
jgi:tripartite-type tricarboxylate transporter receptor subunit TctC